MDPKQKIGFAKISRTAYWFIKKQQLKIKMIKRLRGQISVIECNDGYVDRK